MKMRATWDALAADPDAYVGDPGRGRSELQGLFERLGADPRGGTCVEVGCGPGRMTAALAERFDRVVAVDVSPAMVERARASVPDPNVDFRVVSGERLDGVESGVADALVCYLVLQHLPSREAGRRVPRGVRARPRRGRRGVRPAAGARRGLAPARVARRALGRRAAHVARPDAAARSSAATA